MSWIRTSRHLTKLTPLSTSSFTKICQLCTGTLTSHNARTFKTFSGNSCNTYMKSLTLRRRLLLTSGSYSRFSAALYSTSWQTLNLNTKDTCVKSLTLRHQFPSTCGLNLGFSAAQFSTSRQLFNSDGKTSQSEEDAIKKDPEIQEYLKEIHKDFNSDSVDHSDPSENGTSSTGAKDSAQREESSLPKIEEKSEYIIMQDDMVYDYEELDENYEEMEEEAEEVYLPISLERGTTGVFDLPELVELLSYENARDLCAICVPEELHYVDYLVVVTGRSVKHCSAMAASVKWFFKRKAGRMDRRSVHVEGDKGAHWVAMDLGNIALHIFMPGERLKYDLESLWTVGAEFDENTQKQKEVEEDPFAQYLKDFGHKTEPEQIETKSQNVDVDSRPQENVKNQRSTKSKTGSNKRKEKTQPEMYDMENKTGWHSAERVKHN